MIVGFRPQKTTNRDLQKLQDSLSRVFNSIAGREVIDGRLISGVTITAGTVASIAHGLGKVPRGWLVAGQNANSIVWETENDLPLSFLDLNASADVTINLWIF